MANQRMTIELDSHNRYDIGTIIFCGLDLYEVLDRYGSHRCDSPYRYTLRKLTPEEVLTCEVHML